MVERSFVGPETRPLHSARSVSAVAVCVTMKRVITSRIPNSGRRSDDHPGPQLSHTDRAR
jgi:hypothetical protein